ncbi:MAG: HigA family addiction module antitoxin [Proteobacteria bacterium]|nr:HigA family addiction module antitoxin [Pseudomonadota bacterium]
MVGSRKRKLAHHLRLRRSGCRFSGLRGLPLRGSTMRMHNPPHPGEIIKSLCLEPLGVTVTDAAKALGISRKTLSAILNGRAGVSPEMAVRLSIAFGTSAESWLNLQTQFDLWHAEQRRKQLRVMKLAA